jgi:hypothetical protein
MPETTDPTFYRSPGEAVAAPPERLAYLAAFDPTGQAKDAMAVVDCDPSSPDYGRLVGWAELPTAGNELHHFGWNACSSALCHPGHGDHGQPLERRYLVVPGIRSSRIYVLDDLHAFQAIRRMDEILIANFMVFHDVVREQPYDLWIGDEAWELDYFLHENPEQKRAAYGWLTDFVGWLPMPDRGRARGVPDRRLQRRDDRAHRPVPAAARPGRVRR